MQRQVEAGWSLDWADEFDRDGPPDPALWHHRVRPPYVVESLGLRERSHFGPAQLNQARIEGGHLVIEAKRASYPGVEFISACLASVRTLTGGRVRIRAKVPTGKGIWPSLWLIPPDGEVAGWPGCGEIDLMEHFGALADRVHVNVNTATANIAAGNPPGRWIEIPRLDQDFHEYGLDWSDERLDLLVDGRPVLTYPREPGVEGQWPFARPFEIRLQLAVGVITELGSEVDEFLFPQRMLVDYVRVYRRVGP